MSSLKFKVINESLEPHSAYMLSKYGDLIKCDDLHPYIKIHAEDTTAQAIKELANDYYYAPSVEWFYNNTNSTKLKNEIKCLCRSLDEQNRLGLIKEHITFDYRNAYCSTSEEEIESIFEEINAMCNQEFCRVRMSDMRYGGYNNSIYFRISSVGFNWFNIIWWLVAENKKSISDVTVVTDAQAFGGRTTYYVINGITLNELPVNEFLTLKGNPIIEELKFKTELNNLAYKDLCAGKDLFEAYPNMHPRYVMHGYNILKRAYINKIREAYK